MITTSLHFPDWETKKPFSLPPHSLPRLNTEITDTVSPVKANHLFVDRPSWDVITLCTDKDSSAAMPTKNSLWLFSVASVAQFMRVWQCAAYCSVWQVIYDGVKQTKSSGRQNSFPVAPFLTRMVPQFESPNSKSIRHLFSSKEFEH